jgi:hypothetical protein
MDTEQHDRLIEALLVAAMELRPPVKVVREFIGMSQGELALPRALSFLWREFRA